MNRPLLTLILFSSALSSFAIPADPRPQVITAPDGTQTTVRMVGDEHAHWYVDMEGNQIGARRMGMPRRQSAPARVKMGNYPTIGKNKTLAVLVEFSDEGFTTMDDPHDFYWRMLNQEGFTADNGARGSARDFYLASSRGRFDPEFDVAGPVKLSHKGTYYGSDANGQDCKMGELIIEALTALDADVDFSEYDSDGDGYIDNVFFFYAGQGQADTPDGNDLIWPHSADAVDAWKMNLKLDGVTFNHYACSNEIRYSSDGVEKTTGIGTFVHEFGHVLGLMDHYDTSYGMFNFGLGTWDTMAAGCYNNNMNTPSLFSAFEMAELGWLEYTDLAADDPAINTLPCLADEAKAYRVSVSDHEWYVLENRQQRGWDEFIPGHGLLTWHIDYDAQAWENNKVNADAMHQRVDIVEVDGVGNDATRSGDVMPGAAGVTSYCFDAWDGTRLFAIDDVDEDTDGVIRLLLSGTAFTLPTPQVVATDIADDAFSFAWQPVENASYYIVGVDGAEQRTTELTATVEGLEAESTHAVTVKAGRGSYLSQPTRLEVTTSELRFTRRQVGDLAVTAQDGALSGLFTPVHEADGHVAEVVAIERAAEPTETGYGFDNKADGLPKGWETSSNTYYSVDGFYGAAAPSLRLSSNDSYLVISWPETLIDGVSFWHRANGKGGSIAVERLGADGQWTLVREVATSADGAATTIDMPESEAVRLRFEREGGYIVVDDVAAQTRALQRNLVKTANIGVSGQFTVDGLAEGLYGVRVYALKGEERSLTSAEAQAEVTQSGVSSLLKDQEGGSIFYDLLGRRVANPGAGVYIRVAGGKAAKARI